MKKWEEVKDLLSMILIGPILMLIFKFIYFGFLYRPLI